MYLSFLFNLSEIIGISNITIENEDPNSMYTQYHQGDKLILLKVGANKIHSGDIVVYVNLDINIVHRVQDVRLIDDEYFYRMKGDNYNNTILDVNYERGGTLISYDQIKGKVIGSFDQGFGMFLYAMSNPIYFTVLTIAVLMASYVFSLFLKQFDISLSMLKSFNRRQIMKILAVFILLLSIISITQYSIVVSNENVIKDVRYSTQINAFDDINETLIPYTYYMVEVKVDLNYLIAGDYELNITLHYEEEIVAQVYWKARENTYGETLLSLALVINNEFLPEEDTNLTLNIELKTDLIFLSKSHLATIEDSVSFYQF